MKIREYLEKKYQIRTPTTISYAESCAFGIRYPLKNGWLYEHGARLISVDMAKNAVDLMSAKIERGAGPKRVVMLERGIQILKHYIATADQKAPKIIRREPVRQPKPGHPHALDAFLQTYEWRRVRMEALKKFGARCQCCGASPETGAVMNVDHIKPRRLFPELALDVRNLQVLCNECNHGKGNWDMTDWRKEAQGNG